MLNIKLKKLYQQDNISILYTPFMPCRFSPFAGRAPFVMLNDLDIITIDFPADVDTLRVYAIGDVHVGSREFDEQAIRKKIEIIQNDPAGAAAVCGDLGDFGLKNSKTNIYQATMTIREQIEYIHDLFLPIVHKISACVPGNHEQRILREAGTCPLYDLCVRWGIQNVYRENMAITRYSFGEWQADKPMKFTGVTTHGSSRTKHKRFIAAFSGVDFFISGHTHQSEYAPHSQLVVGDQAKTARLVPYKELVVDANLKPGGYGIKKEYEIAPPPELQYIELTGYRDMYTRQRSKVMSYHSVQI